MKTVKKDEKIRYHMVSPVISAEAHWPIQKTIDQMFDHKIKSILIKEKGKFIGIVTESDLIFKVLLGDLDRNSAPVSAIMSVNIRQMDHDRTLGEAIAFMREKNIRHLAVTEKDTIVGMLSVKDLITYFAT